MPYLAKIALFLTAFVAPLAAQEKPALAQELSNHYIGREFHTRQPYANREVWFDQNGEIAEDPRPVCPAQYPKFVIKSVHVAGDVISVAVERPAPVVHGFVGHPADYTKDVTFRFRSPTPWTTESFDRAFQASLRPRGKFDPHFPGAVGAPPGSDPRIQFLLDNEPVYRVGSGITPPKPIVRADPGYTEAARRARVGGEVMLRLIVNEDGSVSHVEAALPGIGHGLEESSVNTVSRWRFSPGMLDGKPVKVLLNVETSFCLY